MSLAKIKLQAQPGFSLIELLITIAIIVILSALITRGMAVYLQRGRDQVRKSELTQIQQALTLYHNDNLQYPCPGSYFVGTLSDISCGLDSSYIQEIPHDDRAPANSCNSQFSDYSYVSSDGQTYQLYAKLEIKPDPSAPDYLINSCPYNYRVINP